MRALVQRVTHAKVEIDGICVGKIEKGLLILLGICAEDTEQDATYLAEKCAGLRIFTDAADKMNLSCADISGSLLVVSQFTLYGDCKRGKRPNFMRAAKPDIAIPLYEKFIETCRLQGLAVETGQFGADMQITLCNDGPVTIWLDTEEMRGSVRN